MQRFMVASDHIAAGRAKSEGRQMPSTAQPVTNDATAYVTGFGNLCGRDPKQHSAATAAVDRGWPGSGESR
jgi:hypothetical protein